ncbi:MAG: cellulose binding domain-containing protein, partial [Defluviitaleaceae bacterium]|nr:cellulose binding domain-containing protein [Defluviitaleaceae bacterium]
MRRVSKYMALFLAVLMVVAMLPSRLTPVLAATTSTFVGDGFTVEITVHSNWATGHNTQFRITNTSNNTWPHWVFSMNRPLGLRVPTGWGTPWQNNGLFVHQDASETTIRNLGHQAPVAPGGSVTIHTYSNTQRFFMPTDFRLRPAELRLVPVADRTYEVLEHSEWQGAFFNHAISAVNVSSRIIQNWEIHFDVAGGGMNINSVPNARIIQSTSSSAILAYIPGDGQVLHPGQNIHLGMIGTFIPG